MRVHNAEIVNTLNRLADLLEIDGENPFKIRAYRNASRVIGGMSHEVSDWVDEGKDLTDIPGIGKSIAEKITTIVKTGKLPYLKDVESHTPAVLSKLMRIDGLGPKRVQLLHEKLHIRSIKDLKQAISSGKIYELAGFGEKVAKRIQEGIKHLTEYESRYALNEAVPIVQTLLSYLKQCPRVTEVECEGSFRRRKETVGDLDILAIAVDGKSVIDYFIQYDEIKEVISQGKTRSTVRLRSGIQVDLRVVPAQAFGSAQLYFTGSKAHNIAIRKIALQHNLKINEYGVFDGNERVAGRTEDEIYRKIGLSYIEPELREDRGEIEAARDNQLPKLITLQNIRGDLHSHTDATDGNNTLAEMAKAAASKGYEYLAITDHTQHLTMVHGLDKKRLLQQIKKIDRLNEQLNIVILKSAEIDILEDGSLDLPNELLKELDLTVCSVHSKFHLSQAKQTERILRAMDNPYFNILAHPTGRLINRREAYQVDMENVMRAAAMRGCVLELNAQPERMDLSDVQCKMAKDMGVKLVISTDAHEVSQFDWMQFGVYQGRRGWLEASDVINTLSLSQLQKVLKRR
ncbi:MAG: DNA polymerase/3'-5' exonuclease PolX [Gammaproteobacteria bacterium]|nr:DNA polymerase/3'-5' exonuclease PolX [Gammaproteobacteria bacterium]